MSGNRPNLGGISYRNARTKESQSLKGPRVQGEAAGHPRVPLLLHFGTMDEDVLISEGLTLDI